MELRLERFAKKETYTIGRLYVNGEFFCHTLEDTDRGLRSDMSDVELKKLKIKGKTAIPTGRYKVSLDSTSWKFKPYKQYDFCGAKLPRLLNVKQYEGVLIHIGNDATDTQGCILVGDNTAVGKVLNSTVTFKKLYEKLQTSTDGIYITIQ